MRCEMRIDKLLANMNIGSRKEVKKYIKDGVISVNGNIVTKPTFQVNEDIDEITFNNEKIIYERYLYLMMNKPQGFISATEGYNEKTVIDLLDEQYKDRGLFPAGRLDKDTEGLVFLTNDGRLAHNILSPKKRVWKKYYAEVDNDLEVSDITNFEKGIFIKEDNYFSKPAKLEILSDRSCYVYLSEGKYHQVKRMLSALGKNVIYLKRISIGSLFIDENLKLGGYRKLTVEELDNLINLVNENQK